ncbi:glucan endo-1,3-beta-glucosidase-like [Chenopodium quinoa]|uniref:glucan endo-1,3-beta-glucosidase-like n=1 Tax=Chenopodium quinoa TaxID=63459 RepID=UPI000B78A66B|nr:glucan endo-1,3-beta-glucosidase-like [Chenopodium quinoa]
MGLISKPSAVATLLLLATFLPSLQVTEAQIGVCYGRNGDNLPSQQEVVTMYKNNGITRMRLYDPDQGSLQALRNSNIGLILDVPTDKVISLANAANARTWVQNNVVPYASNVNFRYISVGNEIMPGEAAAGSVLPAMQNVQNALNAANLGGKIKVSTAIKSQIVSGFPPSAGVFTSSQYMNPIVNFLKSNNAPLLANIYPYFSYLGTDSIKLDYALFTSPNVQVTDPNNGLKYQNLFDALVDTVYAALAKAGGPNVPIVVSESGWPSAGGDRRGAATFGNAGQYYKGLIGHYKQGTPLKKGAIETYLFAMFDENRKSGGTENNFGLFRPNKQPKYQLSFN